MCACVRALDPLTYFANGSDGVDLRTPALPWSAARLQLAVLPSHVSCLLLHSVFLLSHLLSDLSCNWQPVGPSPCFALAKCEGVGTPVYSQCFLPTINDKDGQVGPSARLFFIMGIMKDPECFHWLMRYAPCTCRANINIRRIATKKTKTPNLLPQMKLLFLCLLNSVLHPTSFHIKHISKFK